MPSTHEHPRLLNLAARKFFSLGNAPQEARMETTISWEGSQ